MQLSAQDRKNLVALFRVSAAQATCYIIVGLALIGLAIYDNSIARSEQLLSTIHDSYNWLSGNLHLPSLHASKLSLYVTWAIIGVVIYLVIWLSMNGYANLKNDLALSSRTSIHPRGSFDRHDFWATIILRKVIVLASLVTLLVYIVAWLRYFAPDLAHSFEHFINEFISASSILWLLVFLVAGFISLHLIGILLRLLSRKFLNSLLPSLT